MNLHAIIWILQTIFKNSTITFKIFETSELSSISNYLDDDIENSFVSTIYYNNSKIHKRLTGC